MHENKKSILLFSPATETPPLLKIKKKEKKTNQTRECGIMTILYATRILSPMSSSRRRGEGDPERFQLFLRKKYLGPYTPVLHPPTTLHTTSILLLLLVPLFSPQWSFFRSHTSSLPTTPRKGRFFFVTLRRRRRSRRGRSVVVVMGNKRKRRQRKAIVSPLP